MKTIITLEQLDKLVFRNKAELFIKPINDTLEKFEINTPKRICHFLAQILHESGNLVYTEETASGKAYEGRKDLGNNEIGDGIKYKGRGLIQITGKHNYKQISNYFKVDFVDNPEFLETPTMAAMSAGWFWHVKKLNSLADSNLENMALKAITKTINGGYNGLEDRIKKYILVKSVL